MLPKASLTTLLHMTPEQISAFVAGVAERVFDIYTRKAHPYRNHVQEAVELAWAYASGSSIPEDAYVTKLIAELDQESAQYCNAKNQTTEMPFGTIVATIYALETAHSTDTRKAESAATFALNEVNRTDRGEQSALKEELQWQLDWLEFTSTCDPRTARGEFNTRNTTEPEWYQRWSR